MIKNRVMEFEEYKEGLKDVKTAKDLVGRDGLIKRLIKDSLENLLKQELNEHLGYEKYSVKGKKSGNSRNGSTSKKVRSDFGEFELETPRDRESTFEPQIVKKKQTDIGEIDEKIISMYAKGMTVRDIQEHIKDLYGIDISPSMVSDITDKVMGLAKEWQERPLQDIYSVVYFDAIHYKIRHNGRIVSKAAYCVLGLDLQGFKDILGIWVGENESASYWLGIANELKNRGVKDILIACMDGLKGLPEALQTAFPDVEIQGCIVHQIRNSLKYVGSKYQKEFIIDLKRVYQAVSEDIAEKELDSLCEKWGEKYPLAVNSWKNNWNNLSAYFKYPPEIRKMIYTTNILENVHRQFRKVTKSKTIFPTDDSLLKMLFLAVRDIQKKWTMPVQNWASIISQFSIMFEGRVILN